MAEYNDANNHVCVAPSTDEMIKVLNSRKLQIIILIKPQRLLITSQKRKILIHFKFSNKHKFLFL